MPDYYQVAQKLAASLPLKNGPVPSTARNVLVNRLKGATPGSHSSLWGMNDKPFRQIFFPAYQGQNYENMVDQITGLGGNWWPDFSIAALCQTMNNVTSSLRQQLMTDKINSVVNNNNNAVRTAGYRWYGYILSQVFEPYQAAVNAVPDKLQLAQTYASHLNSDAWVLAKVDQFKNGNWPDRDWELFNHWVKLFQLGLPMTDIDNMINGVIAKGLPVPDGLKASGWISWTQWLTPNQIDWYDLRGDASSGILAEVCQAVPGSWMPSCMKEENAYEFTANTQPGTIYRQLPSGCCFTGNTLVLMADGTGKPISQVRVGDEVKTPAGTESVAVVATPIRGERSLYSVNGMSFGFTDNHPFLTYQGVISGTVPLIYAVNPMALIDSTPNFAELGIESLVPGQSKLVGYDTQGICETDCASLTAYAPRPEDDTLYDLVLNMDAAGLSEYFIGDGTQFLAVSSEVSRFGVSPLAATVLTDMVDNSWPVIQKAMTNVPVSNFNNMLYYTLYIISSKLMYNTISAIQERPPALNGFANPHPLLQNTQQRLTEICASFMKATDGNSSFDRERGAVYGMMANIYTDELQSGIQMGWRQMKATDGAIATMLAISILDLELSDPFNHPGQNVTMQATLSCDQCDEIKTVSSKEGSVPGYFYRFNEVLYYSSWRSAVASGNDIPWMLNLQFYDGQNLLPYTAGTTLPTAIDGGYQRSYIYIWHGQKEVGRIAIDLRPFTADLMTAEINARNAWQPTNAQQLAQQLSTLMPSGMNALFPNVLNKIGT